MVAYEQGWGSEEREEVITKGHEDTFVKDLYSLSLLR